MTQFQTSKKGVDLIKLFEGFRDRAEQLDDGSWLIGFGQVRHGEKPAKLNRSEASNQLRWEDLPKTEQLVSTTVLVPLTQNEFDALVCLAYNLGDEQFKQSDVVKLLNAGQKLSAAAAFDQWTQTELHGQVQTADGLIRRRAAEKALFLTPEGRPAAVTSALYRPVPSGARPRAMPSQSAPPQAQSLAETREEVRQQLTRILGPNGVNVAAPKSDVAPAPSSAMIAQAVSNLARETEGKNTADRIDDFEVPEISHADALAIAEANERLAEQPLSWLSPEMASRAGIALLGFLICIFGVVWAIQNEVNPSVSPTAFGTYVPSFLYILGGLICLTFVAGFFQDKVHFPSMRSFRKSN